MHRQSRMRPTESGFTLVEALAAIVVLAFGLMAVTNLLVVSASSNSVANQSTAAAATASAAMDAIRAAPWTALVPGGDVTADVGATVACNAPIPAGVYNCDSAISGVGTIHTRWAIVATAAGGVPPGDPRVLLLRVRSEGTGALSRARSRAEFTTFLSCGTLGCPAAP